MGIKSFGTYLQETSLSRVWQQFGTVDIPAGIISAFKNGLGMQENHRRTYELSAKVRAAGFGYVFADGHYKDKEGVTVEETPLVIVSHAGDNGKLKGFLRQWCDQYNQESVLYKPEGTLHAFYLFQDGHEEDLGVFHPNRVSEFMTRLIGRSGGTFVFEEYAQAQMTFFSADLEHRKNNR